MTLPPPWREPAAPVALKRYVCKVCRRTLFEADAVGRLVVVCKRCKASQEVKLTAPSSR